MKRLNDKQRLFEFEWYLRDLFFRANNRSGEFYKIFEIRNIIKTLNENYLKYKTWNINEISDTLSSVLSILQKKGVLVVRPSHEIVELNSKLDRRQCSNCYYINCLGSDEPKVCLRCSSEKLVEFPPPKSRTG